MSKIPIDFIQLKFDYYDMGGIIEDTLNRYNLGDDTLIEKTQKIPNYTENIFENLKKYLLVLNGWTWNNDTFHIPVYGGKGVGYVIEKPANKTRTEKIYIKHGPKPLPEVKKELYQYLKTLCETTAIYL